MQRVITAVLLNLVPLLVAASAQAAPAGQGSSLPPELVGVEWQLVTLQPSGAAAEDTTGLGMSLLLEPDGSANGSGGCNRFITGYTAGDAQSLAFSPIGSTLRLCGEPDDERERRYLATLEAVTAYSLVNGSLRLTSGASGELTYVRPATGPTRLPQTSGDSVALLWAVLALATAALGAGLRLRRQGRREGRS